MPLYEYQCPACGNFEVIQKFADAPLSTCPTCGTGVSKLPSAPAFHLKGSGWYLTDYARKSNGGGKSEGAGESKTSSPSESKPSATGPAQSGGSSTPAPS